MKKYFKAVSVFTFALAFLGSAQAFAQEFAKNDAMIGVHFGQDQEDQGDADVQAPGKPADSVAAKPSEDKKQENRTTASVTTSDNSKVSDQAAADDGQDTQRMEGRAQFPNSRLR